MEVRLWRESTCSPAANLLRQRERQQGNLRREWIVLPADRNYAEARVPMTWVILTGRQSDLDQVATPHKIITNRDYLAHPALFRGQRPKVINLSNSYGYQSRGYYASLLASSRGHRVIPDRRDDHRSLRAEALRERAAGAGAGAQQMPQGTRRLIPGQGFVLLRHRSVEGVGSFREAAVRLVPRAVARSLDPRRHGMGVDPQDRLPAGDPPGG